MSHPSWVRGLKHSTYCTTNAAPSVAPLVGAWIETLNVLHYKRVSVSHPSWVRGLKHNIMDIMITEINVAPLVGAWIET